MHKMINTIQTKTEAILLEKKTKRINPTFKAIFLIIQQNPNVFEFYFLDIKYSPAMNKKSIMTKTEKK